MSFCCRAGFCRRGDGGERADHDGAGFAAAGVGGDARGFAGRPHPVAGDLQAEDLWLLDHAKNIPGALMNAGHRGDAFVAPEAVSDDAVRARVLACADPETLDRWVDNVLTAKTVGEVLT